MSIVITNSSRSITLSKIVAYIISKQINYSNYDIPSKSTPTVDTDAFSVKPTGYRITAELTNAEKTTMELMRAENNQAFTVDDAENSAKNVRLESMEFSANPGFTTAKAWNVTVSFTATDH